jgi:hypothetical protein
VKASRFRSFPKVLLVLTAFVIGSAFMASCGQSAGNKISETIPPLHSSSSQYSSSPAYSSSSEYSSSTEYLSAERKCVDINREVLDNGGMTITYRYTPVFEGGWPPDPYISAVVQVNGLAGSTDNFSQPGRYVDVSESRGWLITGLRVTVSSSEAALGARNTYAKTGSPCANEGFALVSATAGEVQPRQTLSAT